MTSTASPSSRRTRRSPSMAATPPPAITTRKRSMWSTVPWSEPPAPVAGRVLVEEGLQLVDDGRQRAIGSKYDLAVRWDLVERVEVPLLSERHGRAGV